MVHAYPGDFRPGAGDPLTQPTLTLFFEVVAALLTAGVTVVAEAAFVDERWRSGIRRLPVSPNCGSSSAMWTRRSAATGVRAAVAGGSGKTHARLIGESLEDWEEAYSSFERLSIAAPSIDVDTTDGFQPDLEAIVAFINQA